MHVWIRLCFQCLKFNNDTISPMFSQWRLKLSTSHLCRFFHYLDLKNKERKVLNIVFSDNLTSIKERGKKTLTKTSLGAFHGKCETWRKWSALSTRELHLFLLNSSRLCQYTIFLSEILLVFQRCHLKVLKILYWVFKIPSIWKNKSSTCREMAPGC